MPIGPFLWTGIYCILFGAPIFNTAFGSGLILWAVLLIGFELLTSLLAKD